MADGQKPGEGAQSGMAGKAMAATLMARHGAMEAERYNFESIWQRVADLVETGSSQFQSRNEMQGQRRDFSQFDSTGALALDRFAAAMESMVTPRTQKWCKLIPAKIELRQDIMVQRYLDDVNDILFAMRYAPEAGFTTATHGYYRSLGAYGTGAVSVMDDYAKGGVRYQAQFLGDVYLDTNFQGYVDRVHRKFEWDARKARQAFGDGPDGTFRKESEKANPRKFTFIQCVGPSEDYDPTNPARRMPIESKYLCVELAEVVESGGFFSMPVIAGRFSTAPRETYGRSPAITMLNSLNTLNEMKKTVLRAGQLSVQPPLMLPDDDVLRGFNMKSGALNYGALGDDGNPRVVPLQVGANMPIGLEMMEAEQRAINDAFFVTLFQVLVESPRITATEALLRAQEKGALLAPPMGRQQTEFVGPLIQRELDIAIRQGLLPPPPEQLAQEGGRIEVEYTSPLNQLSKSDDAVAVVRTLEAVTPMAQIDPSVLDGFRIPQMARVIGTANGIPASCLATDEEMQAKDASRAEAAQAQQLLAAAPVAGKTALDLAKAQQAGLSAPDLGALLE